VPIIEACRSDGYLHLDAFFWRFSYHDGKARRRHRQERPRQENQKRPIKHLKVAFGATRLAEIAADSIDIYLRERLRDRVVVAIEAFKNQMAISGAEPYLFPSALNPTGHLKKLKTVWTKTLRRAKIPYFRIYDLRSAYATRLSAGGVAEWVTQLLRQSDAQVFKKYSQMKLRMKREALEKLNRRANEMVPTQADTLTSVPLCTEVIQ
jgi:CRISPR/Cas system-associated endoribonuclease Cas2